MPREYVKKATGDADKPITATRDVKAHPIFSNEELQSMYYALEDASAIHPALTPTLEKIGDALAYREDKDQ